MSLLCEGGFAVAADQACFVCGRHAGQTCGRPLPDARLQKIAELQAEVERLRRALKSTAAFLHHCWCDVQMNDYSFQKLNEQMEIVDAALDAARGES